jgi:hypothetical protein
VISVLDRCPLFAKKRGGYLFSHKNPASPLEKQKENFSLVMNFVEVVLLSRVQEVQRASSLCGSLSFVIFERGSEDHVGTYQRAQFFSRRRPSILQKAADV